MPPSSVLRSSGSKPQHSLAPWLICGFLLPLISLLTPADLQIAVTFVIPVMIVACNHGARWACLLAVGMPLIRFLGVMCLGLPIDLMIATFNFVLRAAVLTTLALVVSRLSERDQRLASSMLWWSQLGLPAPREGRGA